MDTVQSYLMLIPLLPLAAAVLTALLGPKLLRSWSHVPAILGIAGALVVSIMLLMQVTADQASADETIGYEQVVTFWTWAAIDEAYTPEGAPPANFTIEIALRADALTCIMLCMVNFVAMLVAIYASGYMHGDSGYWRFFAYVCVFVFSMNMLVSVSNFLLLYVFWEAVGVCSYLLIGFWYEKPEASAAGMKAFLVNRVGDFGFAIAIFLIWITYGTLNFHDTLAPDGSLVQGVLGQSRLAAGGIVGGATATAICLLLLVGACGKSAQFPLHVWLPDAMEGPTPVSALIHAATMVTAGIYMVTRCMPLYIASPDALLVVAVIGAFTALLAGLIALTQNDLKRVLAYSTISQLGFMFLALGTGITAGVVGGMFHLFTHAFFKALLFLGAGSVMHAMGNVIDMRRFGGLRKVMPITCVTFAVGCLALAGLPPLAGFFSKDMIVAAVHSKAEALHHELEHRHPAAPGTGHAGSAGGATVRLASFAADVPATDAYAPWSEAKLSAFASVYHWLYYSALFTAFLTAFYTGRAFFMTFFGEKQIPPQAHGHAHESPPNMTAPLVVLAIAAAMVGVVLDYTWAGGLHNFGAFLANVPSLAYTAIPGPGPHEFHMEVAAVSVAIALAGVGLAAFLYLGDTWEIASIRSWAEFRGLQNLAGFRWSDSLRRQKWAVAFYRGAARIGLGWLASLLGFAALTLGAVLSLPLLLGVYLSPYRLSQGKFFFDEIYHVLFVLPLRGLAVVAYWVDRWVIDGLVNLVGRLPPLLGSLMRSLQMGLVQFYALAMVLSALILLAIGVWVAGT